MWIDCLDRYATLIQAAAILIQAIATVVLVCVTRKYAQATSKILEESKKSRRIAFLEERLRELYNPLRNNPYRLRELPRDRGRANRDEIKEYDEFWQSIKRYSYLASEDLLPYLQEWLRGMDSLDSLSSFAIDGKKPTQQEHLDTGKNVINQVNSDCDNYEKELHELVGE